MHGQRRGCPRGDEAGLAEAGEVWRLLELRKWPLEVPVPSTGPEQAGEGLAS